MANHIGSYSIEQDPLHVVASKRQPKFSLKEYSEDEDEEYEDE